MVLHASEDHTSLHRKTDWRKTAGTRSGTIPCPICDTIRRSGAIPCSTTQVSILQCCVCVEMLHQPISLCQIFHTADLAICHLLHIVNILLNTSCGHQNSRVYYTWSGWNQFPATSFAYCFVQPLSHSEQEQVKTQKQTVCPCLLSTALGAGDCSQ